MNTKTVLIAIAVVLVVGGGIAMTMSRHNSTSTAPTPASTSSQTSTATNMIDIKGYEFSPQATQVKVGTTITWTNQDSVQHTVSVDNDKSGPHSGSLKQGETYSYTFKTAGSYAYDCGIHPSMRGTVTVTQ